MLEEEECAESQKLALMSANLAHPVRLLFYQQSSVAMQRTNSLMLPLSFAITVPFNQDLAKEKHSKYVITHIMMYWTTHLLSRSQTFFAIEWVTVHMSVSMLRQRRTTKRWTSAQMLQERDLYRILNTALIDLVKVKPNLFPYSSSY